MFRYPNKGFIHFKTVHGPSSRLSRLTQTSPMRLQLLDREPSQKAGQLQKRELAGSEIAEPTSMELANLRRELLVEPELDIVRTGIAELRKEWDGLRMDRDNWGVGGKKVALSALGGILGSAVVGAACLTVAKTVGVGLVANALGWTGFAIGVVGFTLLVGKGIAEDYRYKRLRGLLDPGLKRIDKLDETTQLLRETEQHLLTSGE